MGRSDDLLLAATKHLTDPNHQRKCVQTRAQPDPHNPRQKTQKKSEHCFFFFNQIVVTNSDLKIKSICKSVPK